MHLSIALLLAALYSCSVGQHATSSFAGDGYNVETDCREQLVDVYRSVKPDRKLNGHVTRSGVGIYDSTLHFRQVGQFTNGLLNGVDTTYVNDRLIRIETFRNGIRQGSWVQYDDSIKTIAQYYNGLINGLAESYNHNQLVQQTNYHNGIKEGMEYFYDRNGTIITSCWYDPLNQQPDVVAIAPETIVHQPDGSAITFSEWQRYSTYRGVVVIYNSPGYDDAYSDALHPSLLQAEPCDSIYTAAYYVLQQWGGDGLDQIWHTTWLAYKHPGDAVFTYSQLE